MQSSKSRKTPRKQEGTLLYHVKEEKNEVSGQSRQKLEKLVTHSTERLIMKLFKQAGDKRTKIIISSKGTGGEYTITESQNNTQTPQRVVNKKDLITYVKANPDLTFMSDYIGKEKTLA